jgi:predicted transcriptional regulator of viral defense system
MGSVEQLRQTLDKIENAEHCLFTLSDLQAALPELSTGAFKILLSRAQKKNILKRICRGLYVYPSRYQSTGLVLFHAAARLRAHEFNYISLETALSDAGVISQIPMNWITVMSSGRTQTIDCGNYGHIEFIHTKKNPEALQGNLSYDKRCRLWRANTSLAIADMKHTRRNLDLIDRSIENEPV